MVERGGMVERAPVDVVTVHVWRVPPRPIPSALGAVAPDRRQVRVLDRVRFAKFLGTGSGRTFSARDADMTRRVLLTSWTSAEAAQRFDRSSVVERWRRRSSEAWQASVRPLASRGPRSRPAPFGTPSAVSRRETVAAVTRARLAARPAIAFRHAVPRVAARQRHGSCTALGISEAPLGVQGTFSLGADAEALHDFAYLGSAHRKAIRQTAPRRWYAEELFARFAVPRSSGTIDGRDPLAGLR